MFPVPSDVSEFRVAETATGPSIEENVASTVSAEPRQARSPYSLRNNLETLRQWRTRKELQLIRRLQAYDYILSDGLFSDIGVHSRRLTERLIALNRPLEGEPTPTQDILRSVEDEVPLTAVTPKEYIDNAPEVQSMTAETSPEGPSSTTSLLSKTYHRTLTILSRIGLRESDIRRGYTRIRWKNGRGKWLYDDYVEHVPGALEDMKAFLRSSAYVTTADMSGGSQQVPTSSTSSCNPTSSASQTQHSPSSDFTDQLQGSNIIPTSDSRMDVELGEMVSHPPLLLSCLENGRYAVELRQESIIGVADDRQLFHTLRRIYHEHRGRLRPLWSLKDLHSIHFMKFAYGGSRYIDVRCHEEICETGRPCVCVPPEQLVLPEGKEYDCRPIPPKLSPPIGPRLMMDFFNNPQYIAPNSTLIVQQLPKRACGKLQNEYINPNEAWGIFYKEDWNWAKIWWILALGFFPPSLLFGVLWTVFKQDISGAFGVASWWMAGASIIVGIVGTYDM